MTFTIRAKVLLLSLTLFSIPYVGYEYVREMEKYLRDNLESSLRDTAHALASVLNDKPVLFSRTLLDTVREDTQKIPPIISFKFPIQLDGNSEEWADYLNKAEYYADKNILQNIGNYNPNSLSFKYLLGKYKNYLYALFIVKDEHLVYRSSASLPLNRSDHLQIVIQDTNKFFSTYWVIPQAPGWVSAYKVSVRENYSTTQTETRIQGTWQETQEGYTLELRIPLGMVSERLGFAVADVDNSKQREIKTLIGTSTVQYIEDTEKISVSSPEIERIIQSLGNTPGRQIWVLDRQQRVLAKNGDLQREFSQHPLNALYRLLLPPILENPKEERPVHLEGEEILQTLKKGEPNIRWYPTPDKSTVIVSAAYPVWAYAEVIGTVVVEETSNSIQTVQRQAIANLFNKTMIVFLIVTLLLLIFANRLSVQLQRLRNQAETAIDMNGRVTVTRIGSASKDEIGDLSRSFSAILEKLKQYNTYLEGMASRLSHELRTPIAVVRSSLENLESLEHTGQYALSNEIHVYIERAKEGVDRLNTIITRLSEATRLEQALQNTERERFNLTELIKSCVAGYRLAYSNRPFRAELQAAPMLVEGSPDLIAQMLDKLVSNAVDFAEDESPVKIRLSQEKQMAYLQVINRGPAIPPDMLDRLFESMVSLRPHGDKKEPHLGLGLYMVRLIAGYHGGHVRASNNPEEPGAVFTVTLPTRVWEMIPYLK